MASPGTAPLGVIPVGLLLVFPCLMAGAGWWLDGAGGAAMAAVAGVAIVSAAAWVRTRRGIGRPAGHAAVEMKPGVASGTDARTRTAVMDGGTRVGVVPAGRSARGHRDRDL